MALAGDFEVIRDPLWSNIHVHSLALGVVDSAPFQRLRYVRQLGHAYLVYPGATHSRFEHALGAYHLARRALSLLRDRGELDDIAPEEATMVWLAALLHDIGHYPFSHALEEAGLPTHESLAVGYLQHPAVQQALEALGIPSVVSLLADLIQGTSHSPLQGLVAGSLDLDKIEYLTRDAHMCGVPYGTVDVDRLLHSITVVTLPDGTRRVGVHEKGLSAVESLLFAKYQMYRTVYWHHAIRSATAMFKRLVHRAIQADLLDADWVARSTDESLMEAVHQLPSGGLARRLRQRELFKRALDIRAAEVPRAGGDWIAHDPDLVSRVEDQLAAELGVACGEVLIDYPAKPAMLEVDLPLLLRDGSVEILDTYDRGRHIGIQRIADELHQSARRLRVFVARRVTVERRAILGLAERTARETRMDLEAGTPLLVPSA
jgi:HD superfamily phosphohydrolase